MIELIQGNLGRDGKCFIMSFVMSCLDLVETWNKYM